MNVEPMISAIIIAHSRMGDTVYFGPFSSRTELNEWYENYGKPHRVSGAIIPLINPKSDPNDWWYIPQDKTLEELMGIEESNE